MASPLREFSKSGQKLPAIGLGTMLMAAVYGPASTQERVNEVLNRALEKGCLFWDTASVYSAPGTLSDNERQIGSFLRSHPGSREKVFISSKFSIRCHIEETMGALKELKDSGKIKYISVSEFTVEQLERAEKIVHIGESVSIIAAAPSFSLTLLSTPDGTTIVVYSPLGRGFLTDNFKSPTDLEEGHFRKSNPRFQGENFTKNLELMYVIPGTTSPDRLVENIDAGKAELSAEEVEEIDGVINSFKASGERYPPGMKKAF
ncbi:unnamed protein product [Tilletia controversa]|nr:unnamed protein product [Tilletia controversa]